MNRSDLIKLALAAAILGVAGFFLFQFFNRDSGVSEKVFFYDQSEQKLFAAPRNSIPPIRGLDNEAEDAVRAVVISTNGNPRDKKSWEISYLETCSPELKKQFSAAQASGTSAQIGRDAAQRHRLVRRLNDKTWYSLSSEEGERIVSAWLTAGPGGTPAVVCTPD